MSREVPEGWISTTLGEQIAEMRGGGTPSRKVPEYWKGNIPWASVKDLKGRHIDNTEESISEDGLQNCASSLIPKGTLVLATRMAVGKAVRFSRDVAINQDLRALFPRPSLDVDFLHQWFCWQESHVARLGSGTTVAGIRQATIRGLPLALPPLHEQRRIAEILSSVDEAIAATRAVIEQTRKVKQGVLERLLTKGIGHTRFKQTEIGEIPEGWELTSANDVCTQVSVGIVIKPSQYYAENGVRCFRSANVREGFVEDADWVYISEEGNRVNRKSVLRAGDVLVVRTGYPGTSCVVPPKYDGANCIDIIFARPKIELVDPYFLSTFINSASGKTQVLKAEGGLAQKHFNVGAMKQMKLPLPPLNEQHQIVAHIQEFANTEAVLGQPLQQQIGFKSALMSDLLTGRKRVTDALPVAAE